MINFIPAWNGQDTMDISSDELIGQIRTFMESETSYQVLITSYVPFLRYFLHRYELLESNYWNLFDELQDASNFEQRAVKLTDLNLSEQVSFFYEPFAVLARINDETKAIVRFGEGSQIQSVEYMEDGMISHKDIYDDRGFISSRINFIEGIEKSIFYFDVYGKWIFQESLSDNVIIVNSDNRHKLRKEKYLNLQELQMEVLNNKLDHSSGNDAIVFSVTNYNIDELLSFKYLSQTTLSFFEKRVSFKEDMKEKLIKLVSNSRATIVDTELNYNNIKKLVEKTEDIYQISPYDTRFEFGTSQQLKEEIIFFDGRNISKDCLEASIKELLQFIFQEMKNDDSRIIQLMIRINNSDETVNTIINENISEMFPREYEIWKELESIKDSENQIDAAVITQINSNVKLIDTVISGIRIEAINNDNQLMNILNKARITLDLANSPDLFTQIAAISTGIPQINATASEYIINNKNGLVIEESNQLITALQYYLNQLQHWQDAQAFSAYQIKKYSGDALKNYLLEITGDH